MATTGKTPLSLYFHIPFCKKKCPYCHFFVVKDDESKKDLLLDALMKEWNLLNISHDFEIVSVYFGGGTPSLFGPLRIGKLLEIIQQFPNIQQNCEITLEANPCDVTASLIKDYSMLGINRLSLGVQSFSDTSLITIGRQHNKQQVVDVIHDIYAFGIKNISIDLMYDRPFQTLDEWDQELEHLNYLPISHLSLYNLTIEDGSAYKRKEQVIKKQMPDQEASLKLLEAAIKKFETIGLHRYEISAFAKAGYESHHNLGYWQGRTFFGLGPSAFSYVNSQRMQNVCHFDRYLGAIQSNKLAHDFSEVLEKHDVQSEMLAIGLRVVSGVDLGVFQKQFGLLSDRLKSKVSQIIKNGYAVKQDTVLHLTDKGRLFYDDVGALLI